MSAADHLVNLQYLVSLLLDTTHLSLFILFFFFLMIRRPPRSTLFPLHDALPICCSAAPSCSSRLLSCCCCRRCKRRAPIWSDRKSTRLNSSHLVISYAVFCLKKKNHHPD